MSGLESMEQQAKAIERQQCDVLVSGGGTSFNIRPVEDPAVYNA